MSIELTTFFLYRFLSSGIGYQYQSDYYLLLSIIGLSIDYAWVVWSSAMLLEFQFRYHYCCC